MGIYSWNIEIVGHPGAEPLKWLEMQKSSLREKPGLSVWAHPQKCETAATGTESMRVPSRGLNLGEHLHLGGSGGGNQIQKVGKEPGNCGALEGSERRFEEGRQKE